MSECCRSYGKWCRCLWFDHGSLLYRRSFWDCSGKLSEALEKIFPICCNRYSCTFNRSFTDRCGNQLFRWRKLRKGLRFSWKPFCRLCSSDRDHCTEAWNKRLHKLFFNPHRYYRGIHSGKYHGYGTSYNIYICRWHRCYCGGYKGLGSQLGQGCSGKMVCGTGTDACKMGVWRTCDRADPDHVYCNCSWNSWWYFRNHRGWSWKRGYRQRAFRWCYVWRTWIFLRSTVRCASEHILQPERWSGCNE